MTKSVISLLSISLLSLALHAGECLALQNGLKTQIRQYPSSVGMLVTGKRVLDGNLFLCNATKVSATQLLTAAHCFNLWYFRDNDDPRPEFQRDGVMPGENAYYAQQIEVYQKQYGMSKPNRNYLTVSSIQYLGFEDLAIVNVKPNPHFDAIPNADIKFQAVAIKDIVQVASYNAREGAMQGSGPTTNLYSGNLTIEMLVDTVPMFPLATVSYAPAVLEPGDSGSAIYKTTVTGSPTVVGVVHAGGATGGSFTPLLFDVAQHWLQRQIKIQPR